MDRASQPTSVPAGSGTLVVACGALAREIAAVTRANGWSGVTVHYLAPELHNRPERIPGAVEDFVRSTAGFDRILVGYADCGTGGALDLVLERLRTERPGAWIERLPGVHCYEFYAGESVFAALAEAEPGTFYLTDFLLHHYDRLVTRGLGLDRHPELTDAYFGHYRRLVYLAQKPSEADRAQAQAIATRMGWSYEFHPTGYGGLADGLGAALGAVAKEQQAWPL